MISTPVLRVFSSDDGGADKKDAMISNPPLLSPGDSTLIWSSGSLEIPGTVAGRGSVVPVHPALDHGMVVTLQVQGTYIVRILVPFLFV